MELSRHINRRLHEEHDATLALWTRVEATLASRKKGWPPSDPDTLELLKRASASLAHDVNTHFRFEEEHLFPRLAEAGEGDIAELLAEEHAAIRAAAQEFAGAIEFDGHDSHGWDRVRGLVLALAERLISHVQKEEMSLLPALEDLIDEQADAELTQLYATP